MDLLRMVINEQGKSGYSPKRSILDPFIMGRIPKRRALANIENVLHRNEQIAQRRETINRRVVALKLRADVLLDEVQRLKRKLRVD